MIFAPFWYLAIFLEALRTPNTFSLATLTATPLPPEYLTKRRLNALAVLIIASPRDAVNAEVLAFLRQPLTSDAAFVQLEFIESRLVASLDDLLARVPRFVQYFLEIVHQLAGCATVAYPVFYTSTALLSEREFCSNARIAHRIGVVDDIERKLLRYVETPRSSSSAGTAGAAACAEREIRAYRNLYYFRHTRSDGDPCLY